MTVSPGNVPEVDPEAVGAAVLTVPGVARLHGGPFGEVATYLPGRRVTGVRLGDGTGPVEVHVVVTPESLEGPGLRALAGQVAATVTAVTGRPTAVHVADIETVVDETPVEPVEHTAVVTPGSTSTPSAPADDHTP
ncbi:hypothetical protein ACFFKU_04395 [Kineococcus gynurae]|uniref:Asp23/Gls24 family envelope stress response protein n=1 Tax=Kineococcus gynurae TaxID=452979 RepID=A0ABV5LRF1_9ACTN